MLTLREPSRTAARILSAHPRQRAAPAGEVGQARRILARETPKRAGGRLARLAWASGDRGEWLGRIFTIRRCHLLQYAALAGVSSASGHVEHRQLQEHYLVVGVPSVVLRWVGYGMARMGDFARGGAGGRGIASGERVC